MNETVFFQRVTKLCEKQGISITKLANEIGKGSATASGWKKGAVPRPSTLKIIADYFNVSTEYLLGNESTEISSVQTNNGIIGHAHAPVTIMNGAQRVLSANEIELFHMFEKLNAIDQAKVLVYLNDLVEKEIKNMR